MRTRTPKLTAVGLLVLVSMVSLILGGETQMRNTYELVVPDYATAPTAQADEMTDQLLAAYNRTVDELLRQLKQEKNLSNYAKCQICYVLGKMRAQRAVTVLVENIDLKAEEVAPKGRLPRWFSYPAREALVQIGQPASYAIMDIIGSNKLEPTKVHAYAEVVAEIEGSEYALMKLRERHTKTKEDKIQKQYEMVIARVQEIAARQM